MRIGEYERCLTQYRDRSYGLLVGCEWRPLQTASNTRSCHWRHARDWLRHAPHDAEYSDLPRTLRELWKRCSWAQVERPNGDAVALREDHVARGCQNEVDQCPVALALREATGDPWVIFRAFGGDFYGSENCDDDPSYTLEYSLNGVVARFDEDGVCPTGTLYVDRAAKHIDFLPDSGTTPTDVVVDQARICARSWVPDTAKESSSFHGGVVEVSGIFPDPPANQGPYPRIF